MVFDLLFSRVESLRLMEVGDYSRPVGLGLAQHSAVAWL